MPLSETLVRVLLAIIAQVALRDPAEAEAMREIMRRDGWLREDAA